MLLNGATGKVVWSRSDLRDCKPVVPGGGVRYSFRCNYLDELDLGFILTGIASPILIGHSPEKGRVAILDAKTGATRFDSKDHPLGNIREYIYSPQTDQIAIYGDNKNDRYFMAAVRTSDGVVQWQAESQIADDPVWLGVLDNGAALMYGKNRDGRRILSLWDLPAGRAGWQASGILEEDVRDAGPRMAKAPKYRQRFWRVAPLLSDKSGSFVIAFVSHDGPIRLDSNGKLVWRASALRGKDASHMVLDGETLYIIQDKNVFALNSQTGLVMWKHEGRFDPKALLGHSRGVLVLGQEHVDLLDRQSGKGIWPDVPATPNLEKWVKDLPEFGLPRGYEDVAPFAVRDDFVYVAGEKNLAKIGVKDGKITELAKYEFGDDEAPVALTTTEGAIVLESTQNIARFEQDGRLLFHRHYRAPGASVWSKVGTVSWVMLAPPLMMTDPLGVLTEVFGRRSKATSAAERYRYYYYEEKDADDDRKFGFVRMEVTTGQDSGTLWLNQRRPEMVFDSKSERLLLKRDDKILQALSFDAQRGN